jgi:hypothetical protein
MSPRDSDIPPTSEVIPSCEVETPRGGFMARPGLKAPPKHAVVIRGGDVPESDDIPLARASVLPPPPSEPAPDSASDKITLRAIPSRRPASPAPVLEATSSAAVTPLAAHEPTLMTQVLDSFPPPSDAPVVASVVEERATPVPRSRARARQSWLTIVAAAMAGLLLGVISVITTVRVQQADVVAAAQPAGVELAEVPAPAEPQPTRTEQAESGPTARGALAAPPASAAANDPAPMPPSANQPPARTRPAAPKRSIF